MKPTWRRGKLHQFAWPMSAPGVAPRNSITRMPVLNAIGCGPCCGALVASTPFGTVVANRMGNVAEVPKRTNLMANKWLDGCGAVALLWARGAGVRERAAPHDLFGGDPATTSANAPKIPPKCGTGLPGPLQITLAWRPPGSGEASGGGVAGGLASATAMASAASNSPFGETGLPGPNPV